MRLSDQVVVLTGAGRGIGRAIAQKCAEEGAILALLARTEIELEHTLDLVKGQSPDSCYMVCDIADETRVKEVTALILRKYGKVSALINNAGVQLPIGSFVDNSLEAWWKNLEINLRGTVAMTKSILPAMLSQGSGKIVNMSGGGSTSPRVNFSAYGVAKTAVVRFTEILALEVCPNHIDVNAVAPGAINTRMLEEVLFARKSAGEEFHEAARRQREGGDDVSLVANLSCFLISAESDGITGKLISARWDPWQSDEFRTLLRQDHDVATLRRIDLNSFRRTS